MLGAISCDPGEDQGHTPNPSAGSGFVGPLGSPEPCAAPGIGPHLTHVIWSELSSGSLCLSLYYGSNPGLNMSEACVIHCPTISWFLYLFFLWCKTLWAGKITGIKVLTVSKAPWPLAKKISKTLYVSEVFLNERPQLQADLTWLTQILARALPRRVLENAWTGV